jgi:hypothetical protein
MKKRGYIRYFLAKLDLRWKIIDTNMIRMEKIIDIIRDQNIILHGLHLYFSIVERLIWKK